MASLPMRDRGRPISPILSPAAIRAAPLQASAPASSSQAWLSPIWLSPCLPIAVRSQAASAPGSSGERSPRMPLNIAVIGAGIVGVCSASYLQRDGHIVTIFDPVSPGGSCSFGNLGSLSPGSCVTLALPGVLGQVPKWVLDPDGPLQLSAKRLPAALPWLMKFVAAASPARVARIADALGALHSPVFEAYAPLLKAAGAEHLVQRPGQLYVFET